MALPCWKGRGLCSCLLSATSQGLGVSGADSPGWGDVCSPPPLPRGPFLPLFGAGKRGLRGRGGGWERSL